MSGACVALVWLLVSVGGAENPGFKQYEQYLSALGAAGTTSPGWGRAALVVNGLAILVLVPSLAAWRRPLGFLSGAAGLAAIGMAVWPMSCPGGARFCDRSSTPPAVDIAHTSAVLVFTVAVVALLLAGTRQVVAGSARTPRLWPAIPVAMALIVVLGPPLLAVTGLLQRTLLLSAQLVIVCLGAAATSELNRRHRRHAKARTADMVSIGPVSST